MIYINISSTESMSVCHVLFCVRVPCNFEQIKKNLDKV